MKLHFLGTGTSTGIPQIGCNCKVCQSSNPKDTRFRASAIVSNEDINLLIDCGPDFRTQILNCNSPHLNALLITHSHYDHVGGVDDLRPYCKEIDFPIYCKSDVSIDLRNRVPYCFTTNPYPGVPSFQLNDISVGDIVNNLAYITDAKTISDETITKISHIDTLVINALRKDEHISHMSLQQSLDVIKKVNPRIAYLTHLSHDMGLHEEVEATLPQNVKIAYDNLIIDIPN